MLPPIIILSALGLSVILDRKNKTVIMLLGILLIIQFTFFIQKLYFLAPSEYGNFWSYPAKAASEIALENKNNFKVILLSDRINDIEYAYPVYARVDPSMIISQNKEKILLSNLLFKNFDNIYIGSIPDGDIQKFIERLNGSVLYIGSASDARFLTDFNKIEGTDKTPILVIKKKLNAN